MRWVKFFQLPGHDRRLLITVFVWVVVVRLALALVPFGALRKVLDRIPPRWTGPAQSATPERIIYAVKAVSQYVPGASCLTQALAAELLYRARGYSARTCFGVTRNPQGRLEAHAWLEAGGEVILGAVEAGKFTPLLHS